MSEGENAKRNAPKSQDKDLCPISRILGFFPRALFRCFSFLHDFSELYVPPFRSANLLFQMPANRKHVSRSIPFAHMERRLHSLDGILQLRNPLLRTLPLPLHLFIGGL